MNARVSEEQLRAGCAWLSRRIARMWPGEREDSHRDAIFAGTIATLMGGDLDEILSDIPGKEIVKQNVKDVLTVSDGNARLGVFHIGTLAGLAQAGQLGIDDDADLVARLRMVTAPPEDGGWSPWTCAMCRREYGNDYEPDECEDCGVKLTRARRGTEADRDRLRPPT